MKRSYLGVILLCAILFADIVLMQMAVHQYFYENYVATLIFVGVSILLFPIALIVYKSEKDKGGGRQT